MLFSILKSYRLFDKFIFSLFSLFILQFLASFFVAEKDERFHNYLTLFCGNYYLLMQDEWVVCRVFHKNVGIRRSPLRDLTRADSFLDHLLDSPSSLPPLMDIPNSSNRPGISRCTHEEDQEFKSATTSTGK